MFPYCFIASCTQVDSMKIINIKLHTLELNWITKDIKSGMGFKIMYFYECLNDHFKFCGFISEIYTAGKN